MQYSLIPSINISPLISGSDIDKCIINFPNRLWGLLGPQRSKFEWPILILQSFLKPVGVKGIVYESSEFGNVLLSMESMTNNKLMGKGWHERDNNYMDFDRHT